MTAIAKAMPLVSVIIPVYNVLPYLREALDSVIGQTYTNLEILVVDDGSTDGSAEVCDEYARKDPRIRVIHQENCGLSSARNTGLDNMTGRIVAFLDSDDFYFPDMIETMTRAITDNGTDMAACRNKRTNGRNGGGTAVIFPEGVFPILKGYELLCSKNMGFAVWNKLYRRELWDGIRFPEGRFYEDTCILPLVMSRAERITFVNRELMTYRIRKEGITYSCTPKHDEDWEWAFGRFLSFMDENTPEKFPEFLREKAHECALRCTVGRYAILHSHHTSESADARKRIRANILQMIPSTKIHHFPLKVSCAMIRYCPPLWIPVRRVYRKCLQLIRRTRNFRIPKKGEQEL